MDVTEWLFGSSPELQKKNTGTKQQRQFGNQLIQMLQQMSGQGGGFNSAQQYNNNLLQNGPEAFQQFSAPHMEQFQNRVLPQIAERFAGAGALSSSGFGQALGGATSDFQSQLAQMFSQMQQQAASQNYGLFNSMSQTGLNYQPFAYHEKQGSVGAVIPIAAGAAQGLTGG